MAEQKKRPKTMDMSTLINLRKTAVVLKHRVFMQPDDTSTEEESDGQPVVPFNEKFLSSTQRGSRAQSEHRKPQEKQKNRRTLSMDRQKTKSTKQKEWLSAHTGQNETPEIVTVSLQSPPETPVVVDTEIVESEHQPPSFWKDRTQTLKNSNFWRSTTIRSVSASSNKDQESFFDRCLRFCRIKSPENDAESAEPENNSKPGIFDRISAVKQSAAQEITRFRNKPDQGGESLISEEKLWWQKLCPCFRGFFKNIHENETAYGSI